MTNLGSKYTDFHSLQWFVQGDVLLTQYTLGPRGHVIMGFATKPAVFLPLLNTFLKTLGVRLIHAFMAFCQYVSHNVLRNKQIELNFGVRLIHSRKR